MKKSNLQLNNITDKVKCKASYSKITSVIAPIFLAFLFVALIVALLGYNPVKVFSALLIGAFGGLNNISETLLSSVPLIFAGLAVAFAFRASLFNIGVEGQLVIGALAAGWAGYFFNNLPRVIHLPLAILFGMLCAGLWGAFPGYLKAKVGAHEVIITIMMNYIAFRISAFMLNGPMKAPGSLPASPKISKAAYLNILIPGTRLSTGILIAIAAAAIVGFILWKTKFGYKLRAVGYNSDASCFGGINVAKTIVLTMFISGALAGLAGITEVLGIHHRVYDQFSPGYGFDSIAVALLGNNHPFGVVLSAILFGALKSGSVNMQTTAGVSKDLVRIIQAVIIFFAVTKFSLGSIFKSLKSKISIGNCNSGGESHE